MSSHRQQAFLDAPVEAVWDLVGSPLRYPAWWPRVVEVRGQSFDEGDQFVQVIRSPSGTTGSTFLVDQLEDLRRIRMHCELTGTYADWRLTPAQGGTFVDLELGMQPKRMGERVFDVALGRLYFRRWSEKSLDALGQACRGREP